MCPSLSTARSITHSPLLPSYPPRRSPHLIEVRERVRINGTPLSQDDFCSVFWDVYDDLNKTG